LRPLSWLRFLGFAIYGRKGVLLLSPEGTEVDDYAVGVELLEAAYYYSSTDEPRLVDVQGLDDRKSDAYSSNPNSESHEEFARHIEERDKMCVMSEAERYLCDAAHLIPRSKGDEYIKRVTEARKDHENDVIDSINDPRNGLLLATGYHRMLGRGYLAFLKTPNFALSTNDVPPSPVPVPGSGPSGRLTLHYFHQAHTSFVPQNKDASPPSDLTSWPPSVITDFVYACAALKKWGSDDCRTAILQTNRGIYYNDDDASYRSGSGRHVTVYHMIWYTERTHCVI